VVGDAFERCRFVVGLVQLLADGQSTLVEREGTQALACRGDNGGVVVQRQRLVPAPTGLAVDLQGSSEDGAGSGVVPGQVAYAAQMSQGGGLAVAVADLAVDLQSSGQAVAGFPIVP